MSKSYLAAVLEEMRKGKVELPLAKPLKSGDKEYSVLNIDLTTLTAKDMLECENQWVVQYGRSCHAPSQSAAYQLIVAAKALNIPVDDLINQLTMKESVALCNIVVNFLVS